MTTVPTDNKMHVYDVARDLLKDADPYPDLREGGRWIKIGVDPSVDESKLTEVAEALRASGYHVSVVGSEIKATKPDVQWPDVPDR